MTTNVTAFCLHCGAAPDIPHRTWCGSRTPPAIAKVPATAEAVKLAKMDLLAMRLRLIQETNELRAKNPVASDNAPMGLEPTAQELQLIREAVEFTVAFLKLRAD